MAHPLMVAAPHDDGSPYHHHMWRDNKSYPRLPALRFARRYATLDESVGAWRTQCATHQMCSRRRRAAHSLAQCRGVPPYIHCELLFPTTGNAYSVNANEGAVHVTSTKGVRECCSPRAWRTH